MCRVSTRTLAVATLVAALPAWGVGGPADPVQHWSLRQRIRPTVPVLADPVQRAWARNPVDAFILARLAREGLRPAPEADRRVLIRRATFDLTGLPPTPGEVEAFVADPAADAYERLVERLLASPAYGERWGRHWLDVVRYAETEGFEYDRHRPGAWRYRDYVVRSFNDDKPYDRFALEQLAGDELDGATLETRTAAGFHRLGPVRRNAGNAAVAFSRNEVLTEMTDAVGTVFLGLTVGCARCHDHKFDAVSQADYYRLQAFLAATHEDDVALAEPAVHAAWKERTARIAAEINRVKQDAKDLKGAARQRADARVRELQHSLPPPLPTVSSVHTTGERLAVRVLKRGDPAREGPPVGPGFPPALTGPAVAAPAAGARRPRTALARWVTDPANPLAARVVVNRVWLYHFGRGIVETPNDFGVNGARPSHPELLDWLAEEFVAGGWRFKALHRLLITSSTYRQSSRAPGEQAGRARDPEGRLLWRFPPRRLSAEEVRDALLAVSGRLNRKAGGESVVPPAEPDLVNLLYDPAQWQVTADPAEHDRRSVYLVVKRNLRLPFAQVFDQPDAQTSCACRERSTHALQALELLNGATANDLARAFARRLEREAGPDRGRQVERGFRLAAGRPPTPREKALALDFLWSHPLEEFTLALFNLNAFLYVP